MSAAQETKARLSPLERAAQLRAKAERLEAVAAEQARKYETRQKIIIGGAMVAEARSNPEFSSALKTILRKHVTRPVDMKVMTAWLDQSISQ